ncbi:hypothetical protein ABUW04_12380 [Streptacidiphilus sp. N1-10]|uniref:Uncharacterized protein n=1 Tax=Streptacidiphilus jeojiensis TaxID=3229225 RepID=A0ABV6XLF0_9ACTN
MSFRVRNTLRLALMGLAVDGLLVLQWRFGRHSSWAGIAPWGLGFLALTLLSTGYAWWFYGSPQRVAELAARKAARRSGL